MPSVSHTCTGSCEQQFCLFDVKKMDMKTEWTPFTYSDSLLAIIESVPLQYKPHPLATTDRRLGAVTLRHTPQPLT